MSKKQLTIPKNMSYEDALEELESLVLTLEAGDQTLVKSLENFERGIALARYCQKSLSEANQKVQILLNKQGDANLDEFEKPDN